jgi:hypothetical protein
VNIDRLADHILEHVAHRRASQHPSAPLHTAVVQSLPVAGPQQPSTSGMALVPSLKQTTHFVDPGPNSVLAGWYPPQPVGYMQAVCLTHATCCDTHKHLGAVIRLSRRLSCRLYPWLSRSLPAWRTLPSWRSFPARLRFILWIPLRSAGSA